ncbi:serine/threonine-protein kinase SRPK3 [Niveomyces insectorum RCEF 264]|uniref:non-specific serine/threonine protein kinase n=1 Tax=Niveomyces insectorum RCEF 264 TaxID=1081102 RepID=A0A167QR66_9HYPO|nr:serine/threonine-protein kinase SRPK3 [Niveomyces insectorum RCEF 264]
MSVTRSSPPTPPSRQPEDSERRFKTITKPCEWVEDYHPGGLHPVDLGDVFKEGQYKVIRKLGEGSFSNVWLARDTKYVSLKILVANVTDPTNEIRILRFLSTVPEAGQHVTLLLDEFDHEGPNGLHKCLVFEPMGPSVNSMVEELPQFKPRKGLMKVRYPPAMAKSILKQALQSVDLLHENGVSHGDLQPGNLLFCLEDDIDTKSEDLLRQQKRQRPACVNDPEKEYDRAKVERLDGKRDFWAPRYVYVAQPLTPFTPHIDDFKIKLSDMGGDRSDADDDHLCQLTFCIGPLPDDLYKHWTNSSLYFTPERTVYNLELGGVPKHRPPQRLEDLLQFFKSIEDKFDEAAPDIPKEEAQTIKALIRRILQYDPAQRPSAKDILLDPWFSEDG